MQRRHLKHAHEAVPTVSSKRDLSCGAASLVNPRALQLVVEEDFSVDLAIMMVAISESDLWSRLRR